MPELKKEVAGLGGKPLPPPPGTQVSVWNPDGLELKVFPVDARELCNAGWSRTPPVAPEPEPVAAPKAAAPAPAPAVVPKQPEPTAAPDPGERRAVLRRR